MSIEDFADIEESLFAETYDNPDRDYFEIEASEVEIPDPEKASKEYIKNHPELFEPEQQQREDELDYEEENAYEAFTPINLEIQKKFEVIENKNIVKATAESNDMFKTRKLLYDRIKSSSNLSLEQCDMYSRCLINKLWLGDKYKYNEEIENILENILNNYF
jgi:hypothetical protein